MGFLVACANCGARHQLEDHQVGHHVWCDCCQKMFYVSAPPLTPLDEEADEVAEPGLLADLEGKVAKTGPPLGPELGPGRERRHPGRRMRLRTERETGSWALVLAIAVVCFLLLVGFFFLLWLLSPLPGKMVP